MPINSGLADVSNDFLLAAVVIYAFAMLADACDFAVGRRQARVTSRTPAPVESCRAEKTRCWWRPPVRVHRLGVPVGPWSCWPMNWFD